MKTSVFQVFHFFQNKQDYLKRLAGDEFSWKSLAYFCLLSLGLLFAYGLLIGSYSGCLQALSAGIKLPALLIFSLMICLPTFHVIQTIIGSQIGLKHLTSLILSGAMLSSWILVAFIPIIAFFMFTGNNYYFLILLHIAIMAFSSFFGIRLIIDGLKFSCEQDNIYPKTGVVVFRIWMVIFLFVSIQLGWNLRPFLGDKDEPFQVFRKYDGNFYTAIIYSIDKLVNPGQDESSSLERFNNEKYKIDKADSTNYAKKYLSPYR